MLLIFTSLSVLTTVSDDGPWTIGRRVPTELCSVNRIEHWPTHSLDCMRLVDMGIGRFVDFFPPRTRQSGSVSFMAVLLLMSGIESNPGPPRPSSSSAKSTIHVINSVPGVKFGRLNVRSCRSKAALLHNIIDDNNLDSGCSRIIRDVVAA
jgi:hypothetical protein